MHSDVGSNFALQNRELPQKGMNISFRKTSNLDAETLNMYSFIQCMSSAIFAT